MYKTCELLWDSLFKCLGYYVLGDETFGKPGNLGTQLSINKSINN